jgi:hypothetical protein
MSQETEFQEVIEERTGGARSKDLGWMSVMKLYLVIPVV